MVYKYSGEVKENCAKAVGVSLPISLKQSIMVCASIRGKPVDMVKEYLANVAKKKKAVPFTRFNRDMGHRRGMAAGRFPVNAAKNILSILESAESNAQFKGLSTGNLIITHASAQKGPSTWRFGRHRRRKAKRTHVEIILAETRSEPKPKKEKTGSKKGIKVKKPEIKKEVSVKKIESEIKEQDLKQEVKND
ncbi:50S ribosomal protein L22 [Candidatus Woesearchaeota archaeon]|nr:50S ribosomal protein L22 [Candidatus Woesearchaeota archaeon]